MKKMNLSHSIGVMIILATLLTTTACSQQGSTTTAGTTSKMTATTSAAASTSDSRPGVPSNGVPGGEPSGGGPGEAEVETGTGAYVLTNGENLNGGTYTSTNADENAVRAEGSMTATLSGVIVSKTAGDASSSDASSFYGLNAAVLALDNAALNISGGEITASAEGANGVFAYGGAVININDTEINVSGGNAGGIEVAGGGSLYAGNLTVTSAGKAAIRSDRGGGILVADGGTYTTTGSSGAPAIYSTADITVKNAILSARQSEAIVVEGLNSVTLENCSVTGNMTGMTGESGENIHNVMLYQSMSGDAAVGNSSFTMTGGTLTGQAGDMFYVTNTECVITLSRVSMTLSDTGSLLLVAGNDGSRGWGTAGANGGKCTFQASAQNLNGDIHVNSISTLNLSLSESSTFNGSINADGVTAKTLAVTLDASSTWTLTADSYITAFNGDLDQVDLNGFSLYVNGSAVK